MLDLSTLDLSDLCTALEDNDPEHSWWLDPRTGGVELWSEEVRDELDVGPPEERGLVPVEPIESRDAYGDMEDFVARVRDARPRDLLARAIEGRGAFRRFKDSLLEFPALREAWFAFHDARMESRAIEWLADRELISASAAQRALRDNADLALSQLGRPFDPQSVAREVAADLRGLYGDRLKQVLLFGSWARGDAHPESDIDLMVVLDRVESRWDERDRMSDILWEHSLANDTVVTEVPVSEAEVETSDSPLLTRVRREAIRIA